MTDRRTSEVAQGARIASRAEEVWGWKSPAGRARWQRRVGLLIRGIRQDDRVLELGCGTGALSEALLRAGARVTAIDISEDLLKAARERIPDGVRYLCRDIEYLAADIGTFDAVVGSSILHHADAAKVLRGIREVLRPGGLLRFAEPNMMNPQIFLQKHVGCLKRWAGDTPHETAFFRGRLIRMLEGAGYTDIAVTNFDFLHPSVPPAWIDRIDRWGRVLEKTAFIREISGSLLIEARTRQENAHAPQTT